jgi:hypothetical protein
MSYKNAIDEIDTASDHQKKMAERDISPSGAV